MLGHTLTYRERKYNQLPTKYSNTNLCTKTCTIFFTNFINYRLISVTLIYLLVKVLVSFLRKKFNHLSCCFRFDCSILRIIFPHITCFKLIQRFENTEIIHAVVFDKIIDHRKLLALYRIENRTHKKNATLQIYAHGR